MIKIPIVNRNKGRDWQLIDECHEVQELIGRKMRVEEELQNV